VAPESTALSGSHIIKPPALPEVMTLIFDGFNDALAKGDRIEIRGFGSFVMRDYRTYTGRNPKTGKEVMVKPKRLAYFKVGKELIEKVNGSAFSL